MDPLGRAVYFGELCGMLTMLEVRDAHSRDGTDAMLVGQGLPRRTAVRRLAAAAELGRATIVDSQQRRRN